MRAWASISQDIRVLPATSITAASPASIGSRVTTAMRSPLTRTLHDGEGPVVPFRITFAFLKRYPGIRLTFRFAQMLGIADVAALDVIRLLSAG